MGILVHDEAESNAPIVFTISVVESWFFLEDCTAAAWEEAYHATPARLSRTNQNGKPRVIPGSTRDGRRYTPGVLSSTNHSYHWRR